RGARAARGSAASRSADRWPLSVACRLSGAGPSRSLYARLCPASWMAAHPKRWILGCRRDPLRPRSRGRDKVGAPSSARAPALLGTEGVLETLHDLRGEGASDGLY